MRTIKIPSEYSFAAVRQPRGLCQTLRQTHHFRALAAHASAASLAFENDRLEVQRVPCLTVSQSQSPVTHCVRLFHSQAAGWQNGKQLPWDYCWSFVDRSARV